MLGILYHDNSAKPVLDKITNFVKAFTEKTGIEPEIVEISLSLYDESLLVPKVKIRPSMLVMKNCFFVGVEL